MLLRLRRLRLFNESSRGEGRERRGDCPERGGGSVHDRLDLRGGGVVSPAESLLHDVLQPIIRQEDSAGATSAPGSASGTGTGGCCGASLVESLCAQAREEEEY